MSCKKIIFMQLTPLLLILFTSCQKDPIYHPPPFDDEETTSPLPEVFTPKNNVYSFTDEVILQDDASYLMDSEGLVRNLILDLLFQLYQHPDLRDLVPSNSADIRDICPDTTLTVNNGISTLLLDYNDCTTLSGAVFQGSVTVVIDGDRSANGTTIGITLSEDFSTSETGDLDGTIALQNNQSSGSDRFDITEITLSSTDPSSGESTTIEIFNPTEPGYIELIDVNNNDDTAYGLIDDRLEYTGCLKITSPSTSTYQICSNEPVHFSILCGIPYEGNAIIQEMNGSTLDSIGVVHFYYPNSLGNGVCDNQIEVILNSETTIIEL